ncbi:hypothetical protein OsJ_29330 [Oryza sativa Japonica Group]|uniref:Uncharacterized protein n=1 Tax=Oryza sativa subsp. japonica TaxID=39947 RepID=Q6ESL1_ORYSJ|nr:hypothetical protein OsJ_29330 [Oryza sativa Japonica Group]BAD28359.1 hypothetical protein [Oryza sativa Japonica Group]
MDVTVSWRRQRSLVVRLLVEEVVVAAGWRRRRADFLLGDGEEAARGRRLHDAVVSMERLGLRGRGGPRARDLICLDMRRAWAARATPSSTITTHHSSLPRLAARKTCGYKDNSGGAFPLLLRTLHNSGSRCGTGKACGAASERASVTVGAREEPASMQAERVHRIWRLLPDLVGEPMATATTTAAVGVRGGEMSNACPWPAGHVRHGVRPWPAARVACGGGRSPVITSMAYGNN